MPVRRHSPRRDQPPDIELQPVTVLANSPEQQEFENKMRETQQTHNHVSRPPNASYSQEPPMLSRSLDKECYKCFPSLPDHPLAVSNAAYIRRITLQPLLLFLLVGGLIAAITCICVVVIKLHLSSSGGRLVASL